ncbi:hypothetical protein ABPG75_008913 [Micractinium tetrahymenae]
MSQTRAIYGAIRDGRLQEAVSRLQAVLRLAPGSRAALSLLAYCYYQQEEYEAAAERYGVLVERHPEVPEYRMHWAQSLCKAGRFAEAARAAAAVDGFTQAVRQLQAAIKYEAGDLRGCRSALEALPPGGAAATAAAGCIAYKEGQYAAAAAQFREAAQMVGYSPELAYAVAACQYQQRDYAGALASLAEIVEAGVQRHPELGIGTQTQGMEARSVGNSAKLKQTALVEAFNLRAAVELQLGNPTGAAAALSDMPPRQEHELDPVTLHNQALVALASAAAAPSLQAAAGRQAGLAKLLHLLAHPPFPPELAGNLLSLCCRPSEGGGPCGSALGSTQERADVAEEVLGAHAALVAATVPPGVLPLYEACLARMRRGPEEAAAKLDELAGSHIEGLRKRVKAVQDARWAGDHAAAAAGLEAYEAELEAFLPVLMSLAHLHWEAGAFGRAQAVLQQSAEFCSDHPVWRLNLGHVLVAQEGGKLGEAAELYESLVQHFAGAVVAAGGGAGAGGSLLDVPPWALANLCVCHVVGSQNEVAEDLLRRLEDEVAAATGIDSSGADGDAAGGAMAGGGVAGPVPPHLSLTNLAIGTLYCAKGNFEFGITRVTRSLEPLAAHLDAPRWRAAMLCLLVMLDQVAKNMLVLKDALVADLLAFLEDVEAAGRGVPALVAAGPSAGSSTAGAEVLHVAQPQTICGQARSLRAMLLKMSE